MLVYMNNLYLCQSKHYNLKRYVTVFFFYDSILNMSDIQYCFEENVKVVFMMMILFD